MTEQQERPTGASLARGKSEQNVRTPEVFLDAVKGTFGPIDLDLAATLHDTVTHRFISPEIDSLNANWVAHCDGVRNAWLNPPYSNIRPWAQKCAETVATPSFNPCARILLLVPASVGANWFVEHVHRKALVLALQGRITFVGHAHPFPRDLLLCAYGVGLSGFDVWDWNARRVT